MKVGVENHWRLNGIKISSMRARTERLTSLERQRFNLFVIQLLVVVFATRPEPVKYSTVKCKHFSAVLVYLAKVFREISVEKYKEFKEVNFYSMRARTKVKASSESQRIERAFICIFKNSAITIWIRLSHAVIKIFHHTLRHTR